MTETLNKELILEINGRTVLHNNCFAYDGCHKIYVIEDDADLYQARDEYEYGIYSIESIEDCYNNSCPLKFIYNWKLTERYVKQGERATFNFIESY